MPYWRKIKLFIMSLFLMLNIGQMLGSALYVPFDCLIQHSMLCLIYLSFFLKITVFLCNWGALRDLEYALKATDSLKIPKNYSALFEKHTIFANTLAKYNRILVLLYTAYFCFYKSFFNGSKTNLLYDGLLPCDKNNGICDTLIYVIQTIFSFISVLMNTNFDCLFSKLVTICVCLIEVLQQRLRMLEFKDDQKASTELRHIAKLHVEILK